MLASVKKISAAFFSKPGLLLYHPFFFSRALFISCAHEEHLVILVLSKRFTSFLQLLHRTFLRCGVIGWVKSDQKKTGYNPKNYNDEQKGYEI